MKKQKNNKISKLRFGIKWRLISFFSAILAIISLVIIFFASTSFRSESSTRIQEANFDYVRFSGDWIESEIRSYISDARYIVDNLNEGGTKTISFAEDSPIVFVATVDKNSKIVRDFINANQVKLLEINENKLRDIHLQTKALGKIRENTNVFNASIDKTPLLGISFYGNGNYQILYVYPSQIQKHFGRRKFTNTFMINNQGDILFHPDVNLVTSRSNLNDNELVTKMWESPLEIGQSEYTDANKEVFLASYRKLNVGSLGLIAQVQKKIVFLPVDKIQERNLIILGIGLCLGVIVIYFLTKIMVAPILTLSDAMQKIEVGNFSIPKISIPKHEIGNLIKSFQKMVQGLAEREKIRHLLGIFVSKEVAQTVMQDDQVKDGQQKKLVVFFSDIRGFTSISEKITPNEVVSLLNQYFQEMVTCIDNFGGVVDKFIGDGLMAYWGAFSQDGDEIERAIDASLQMRERVKHFNMEITKQGLPNIRIGVGLNYGDVIAGVVGSKERRQYTVIGDAVNLSSRIEGLTKRLGVDILIHEVCYKQVKHLYNCVEFEPQLIRGKKVKQKLYAVLSRKNNDKEITDLKSLRQYLGIIDVFGSATVVE